MARFTTAERPVQVDGSAGIPAFLHYDPYYPRFWEHLKDLIAAGYPILLRLYPGSHYPMPDRELHGTVDREGHVVLMVGYDDTTREAIVADPWNKEAAGGERGGLTRIPYDQIKCLWVDCTLDAMSVPMPWKVEITWPTEVEAGQPFEVEAFITYTCPPPLSNASYHVQACHALLELPEGISFWQDTELKRLGDGFLKPGDSRTVSWRLSHTGPVNDTATVRVRGLVVSNDPYLYSDIIGVRREILVKAPSPARMTRK
jgi:hypothetical protein